MGILRHLQHWLIGQGPQLLTAEFVPEAHPIRLWADTFPWDAMVQAVEQSFTPRFPKKRPHGGRPPVSPRVLLALELLKHELGASDEDICQRLRTDVAVMYACGLRELQADRSHAPCVLPETLAQFRHRIDAALMDELLAIQAAGAMQEGLGSPAHLLVDTFPAEQGSQRVTDATTLYKAQKKACDSLRRLRTKAHRRPRPSVSKHRSSARPSKKSCAALAGSAAARAKSSSDWCAKLNDTCESWESPLSPGASKPENFCTKIEGGARRNASGCFATWRPPAPHTGTSPSNRRASAKAKSWPAAKSSLPMTLPLLPSSKARATALPSLAARPASCLSPHLALSSPIGCPWAILATRAMCCPCSIRCNTPSTLSSPPPACGSTRWAVIWESMTPSCVRPCMPEAFSL